MLVLDTNHFSEFQRATKASRLLRERIAASTEEFVLTVVTPQEVMRGWLEEIQRHREGHRLVETYRQFQISLQSLSRLLLLPWTDASAGVFRDLRAQGIRIGTLDLRIASIVLANQATLLTRNLRDFRQVPGLRLENWLD